MTPITRSAPTLERHRGQRALHHARDIDVLIRASQAAGARRDQEAWIAQALVDETFELVVVHVGDEPVAVLEMTRAEPGMPHGDPASDPA